MRNLFVCIILSVFLANCSKGPAAPGPDPAGILPTLSTSAISSLTVTSAVSGGNITADGGSPVTERGVCWNTTPNPVVSGNHTSDGTGTGLFSSNITGLTPNTTYYVRAYAKTIQGIAYGNEVVFQTIVTLPPGDVASLFFITAASSTTNRSFFTYDVSKNKLWEIPNFQTSTTWSTPAYFNGKLYIPSSFSLFSRNAADGSVNWNYTSAGNVVNPQLKDDTLITASALIAPSASNAIVLINKNTGNVIWSKSVNDEPAVTPVLSEGKIYNLTVNGTGSVVTISAYDVATQNLLWQKILANAFFAPAPLDMMVRHDSLIVFSSPATLHVINKNNGNLYWSKSNAAYTLLKYKNDLAFNDNNTGQVKVISLQTGNIILQSAPITYTSTFRGYSYIYNDAFYHVVFDSVFCTSLIDGLLKWRKKYETSLQGFFLKLIPVGNTVYGYRTYDNANDQSKLMILNALDFTARDSIIIPKREFSNFSVLSASGIIY